MWPFLFVLTGVTAIVYIQPDFTLRLYTAQIVAMWHHSGKRNAFDGSLHVFWCD